MVMTAGAWWQVIGGVLEFLGLATVIVGISETRRRFTNRPSLVARLLGPTRWLYRKLFRKGRVVELKAALDGAIGIDSSARLKVTRNWESLSTGEAIKRIQEDINRHEDMLDKLADQMDRERAERIAADTEERSARDGLKHTLESRIADAAAGGLTLETWGAASFALGIVSTVVGVAIG
jgi:hypothetical protein